MKALAITALFLMTMSSYAAVIYCGRTDFHIKIYTDKNDDIYHYVDNTDLNDLKSYPCQEFNESLPFYDEVQKEFIKAQDNINEATYGKWWKDLDGAATAVRRLEKNKRFYCGNPRSGGLYFARTKQYGEALYLYDIETKKYATYDCMNI
ncbi:hypothetical protein ACRXCV_10280 [Halobacteriovorax sp. GFR7]|uniref:hypothetical protein n=1 Tax=unclassified Halobacteriovorax TaxID=2639665 RepID=UPI003D9917D8